MILIWIKMWRTVNLSNFLAEIPWSVILAMNSSSCYCDLYHLRYLLVTLVNTLLGLSFRTHILPRWPNGKVSASRAENPGFESRFCGIFSGSSHTSDLKIGTLVATLPGAWCYRVSTGTGWPGVSILWLGEVERLICNFSVWQHV